MLLLYAEGYVWFIGSVEPVTESLWIFEDGKMLQRNITFVPGLYKIFDEILLFAVNNRKRDHNMDTVMINISP